MNDGVAELLAQLDAEFPAVEKMSGPQARAAVVARRAPVLNIDDVESADDRVVAGVPVRLYRPHGLRDAPRPGVVFSHGGGFVVCDIESHDGFCRALARYSGTVVVSVDYRRAPEDPAPTAAEDVFDVFSWVAQHAEDVGIDPQRLAVAGDSAGGNLAAVTAILCRERGVPPPAAQILIYPMIDPACDTQSHRTRATGCMTTAAAIEWYWRQYLGPGPLPEPAYLVAPARLASHAGLPPAVVLTAGLDPLHDDGVAYARALRAAGVPVVHRDYPGLFHGFVTMMTLRAGAAARELLWDDVRDLVAMEHA
ncbi:MAG TPA: alpha/beta hydrolase [Mycobacterium sp.]|jgi:acetyl esterase